MAEYIEREALLSQIKTYEAFDFTITEAVLAVERTPAEDVVEVVRCKDCKYWHESTGFCSKNSYFIDSNEISCSPLESPTWTMWGENDFCSNGEMKDK